uniref:Ig-like domain-containing protein n=1 Tax=Anas platyrhynchos platyrhynchos TaxID=8840 RepID=A0A493TQE0_ANAPP
MPPPGMWALGVLGLALSCRGAGAFVMHMASSCSLAANGSEQGFDFTLAFNKQQLVCYEPNARFFYACHWGLLHGVATVLANILNGSTLVQRAEARRQACSDLAPRYWAQTAQRRTPPQLRVVPTPLTNVPDAVLLTCHVWGFYPPEVSVQWLHGSDVVASGDTAKLLPAGDWTYQTQVDLRTTAKTGDTYTCLVQHASLEQPLRESWSEPRGWGRGCGAPGSPVAQRAHSRPPCRSWIVPGDDGDGGGGRHRSGRGVGGPGRRRLRLLPPASGRGSTWCWSCSWSCSSSYSWSYSWSCSWSCSSSYSCSWSWSWSRSPPGSPPGRVGPGCDQALSGTPLPSNLGSCGIPPPHGPSLGSPNFGRVPDASGQLLPAGGQRLRDGLRLHPLLQQEPAGVLRPRQSALRRLQLGAAAAAGHATRRPPQQRQHLGAAHRGSAPGLQ